MAAIVFGAANSHECIYAKGPIYNETWNGAPSFRKYFQETLILNVT